MNHVTVCWSVKEIYFQKFVLAGVDVILDCVGASYFQRNLDSLNIDGRLFIIGTQSGAVTQVDLRSILARRLTVQGSQNAFCWFLSLMWLAIGYFDWLRILLIQLVP